LNVRTEKAGLWNRRRFSVMNDAPIILAGHRVEITLAQEALVVYALDQLVHVVGIAPGLVVKKLNRPGVLLAPMNRFLFLVPANRFGHLGRGNGQRQRDQQDHEQHSKQQESFLVPGFRIGPGGHWRSGSVCVL
jgi:hypothetical protein